MEILINKARLINHSCNPNCEALDQSKSKYGSRNKEYKKKWKNYLMIMDLVWLQL